MITGRTAALILAGGNARRMGGGDKPLLTLNGVPILRRIMDAIDLPDIAISANGEPKRVQAFGCPVLGDGAYVGQGPLAGILAGLHWAAGLGADTLLTVPGDTPFIPTGLANALAPAPCCAASFGRVHHLVALWPVDCRAALESFLLAPGMREVRAFTARIGMHTHEFTIESADPFLNVNTPDDLALAQIQARGAGARELP